MQIARFDRLSSSISWRFLSLFLLLTKKKFWLMDCLFLPAINASVFRNWAGNTLLYLLWSEGQNLRWKLGQQSAICWNSLSLFRDCRLNDIFFRNWTFLFYKIESWNFQHIFETENQFIQIIFIFIFLSIVWLGWNSFSNRCLKFQRSISKNKKNITKIKKI